MAKNKRFETTGSGIKVKDLDLCVTSEGVGVGGIFVSVEDKVTPPLPEEKFKKGSCRSFPLSNLSQNPSNCHEDCPDEGIVSDAELDLDGEVFVVEGTIRTPVFFFVGREGTA